MRLAQAMNTCVGEDQDPKTFSLYATRMMGQKLSSIVVKNFFYRAPHGKLARGWTVPLV